MESWENETTENLTHDLPRLPRTSALHGESISCCASYTSAYPWCQQGGGGMPPRRPPLPAWRIRFVLSSRLMRPHLAIKGFWGCAPEDGEACLTFPSAKFTLASEDLQARCRHTQVMLRSCRRFLAARQLAHIEVGA